MSWKEASGPVGQRPFTILRQLHGLDVAVANAIGDALIDAGLECGPQDGEPSKAAGEDAFAVGDRVQFLPTHKVGKVTAVKKATKGSIALFYVEWDLPPGVKKKAAQWCSADELARVQPAVQEEAWRNRPLSDLQLPKLMERSLRNKKLLSAGQVSDWLDGQGTTWIDYELVRGKLDALRSTPAPASAETKAADNAKPKCRVCGCVCTDADCRQRVKATGHPCVWIEEDLCSRCADEEGAELAEEMEGANA